MISYVVLEEEGAFVLGCEVLTEEELGSTTLKIWRMRAEEFRDYQAYLLATFPLILTAK